MSERRNAGSARRVYRVEPVTRAALPPARRELRAARAVRDSRPRQPTPPARTTRRAAGLLVGAVLALGLATLQLGRLAMSGGQAALGAGRVPDPAAADALVSAVAAGAAAALCAWLLLGTLLTCAEIWTSAQGRAGAAAGRWSTRVAPMVLRHGIAAVLGVTLGMGTLPAAIASPNVPSSTSSATGQADRSDLATPGLTARSDLSPGWTPTRPAARHTADPAADSGALVSGGARRPRARAQLGDEVVVRRGDTLWSLAARQLGRDASDAQIALEWPTWFEANRPVIGADPDLLRPGTRLNVPQPGGAR